MTDYYSLLELPPDASPDAIKNNYRRLAMQWHPDRNAGSKEAEERFKALSEAYTVLSNPDSRAAYDARRSGTGTFAPFGTQNGGPSNDGPYADVMDFWQAFFGAGARFTQRSAEDLFMEEMHQLASELTMRNVPWQRIAQELIARGCPETVAREIAQKIELRRKELVRSSARAAFVRSAFSGFAGLGLFSLFGGMGFGLLGFAGLVMLFSASYNLIRALYFLYTGNAPSNGVM